MCIPAFFIIFYYLPGSPDYTMYGAFLYITSLQTSQWIKRTTVNIVFMIIHWDVSSLFVSEYQNQNPHSNQYKDHPRNLYVNADVLVHTLEPVCPLFWGFNPPKQGFSNQNRGHLDSRYLHIYYMFFVPFVRFDYNARVSLGKQNSPHRWHRHFSKRSSC